MHHTQVRRTLVVVSHSHWDREWYQPFQYFRTRLVRMLDKLLDLFDRDPDYRHFVLDGQTIVLEDYLEVRPDRRPDIERHVREGRLLIGPHYMLPDEFLIGGESHVRNLLIGMEIGRQFGPVMMVGYSPDAFGHIAHLPAVLRGFGIDAAVFWRGVSHEATTSEFRWAAPDGSEVLALHLPFGYALGMALPADPSGLRNRLQNLRGLLEPLAATRYLVVPNGNDHAEPQEDLSQVIRGASGMLDDADMVHGHYPMLVEAVKSELNGDLSGLPRLEGELRSSARSHVLAGVLSARMWIKQRYQECEDLLARWAEPLAAWAHLIRTANGDSGDRARSDAGLLRHAWKLLLQNGPHDSICGCSIDQVHEEMKARFDECAGIADSVLQENVRYLANLAAPARSPSVVVFNSENGPRTDFCRVRLPVEGNEMPVALAANSASVPLQLLRRGLRSPLDARERVEAGFVGPGVPGFGYQAFRVQYGEARPAESGGKGFIENKFFRVSADPADGTLTIEDRTNGAVLSGLNRFVDGGDAGDEYNYCPPASDERVDRPSAAPAICVVERGPARHALEAALTYALPKGLSQDRRRRSEERAECRIVTRAYLYPGVPRVDFETEVDNRAEDHRLRAHFPSGLRTDASLAEQHFGVLRRPTALPPDDPTWLETPIGTYPQKSFVALEGGARGLMLANRGLPEYETVDEADGTATIALTLLRCVGWLSRDDIRTRRGPAGPSLEAPGAQMIGRWSFEYSVIPYQGSWTAAFPEAHRFSRPLRALRTTRGTGKLPSSASLLAVQPDALVVSTLKLAEDGEGVAVRVYNTSFRPVEGRLRLEEPFDDVELVKLNEETTGPATREDGWAGLSLRPNEIATLKFKRV